MNISLVFYGENESDYGNPLEDAHKIKRDDKYHNLDLDSNVYLAG